MVIALLSKNSLNDPPQVRLHCVQYSVTTAPLLDSLKNRKEGNWYFYAVTIKIGDTVETLI